MQIGPINDVLLTSARDMYLFNCQVAGKDSQTLNSYWDVLSSFIQFTGKKLVRELKPGHVSAYIEAFDSDDYPDKGIEHARLIMDHYVVIHTWIRWLLAQKFVSERYSNTIKPPRQLGRLDLLMAANLMI